MNCLLNTENQILPRLGKGQTPTFAFAEREPLIGKGAKTAK